MIQQKKRVYVAYADSQGKNEFLIREGQQYYVLTSQKDVISVSAEDAYRILKLLEEKVLLFRGLGTFNKKINNIAEDMILTLKRTLGKWAENNG